MKFDKRNQVAWVRTTFNIFVKLKWVIVSHSAHLHKSWFSDWWANRRRSWKDSNDKKINNSENSNTVDLGFKAPIIRSFGFWKLKGPVIKWSASRLRSQKLSFRGSGWTFESFIESTLNRFWSQGCSSTIHMPADIILHSQSHEKTMLLSNFN